jgi:hypothetical protein
MADKKITELPFIDTLSGSLVGDNSPLQNTVIPLVLRGNTNQINIENFSKFVTQYSAHTGSAGNHFKGNQTITGSLTITGRLTVREVVAEYETASILFSTGSTKLGDQITDKHEFTGSTNITGSFIVNGANLTDFSASNSTLFTNYSSSVSQSISSYSSSNSTTFTNLSSSNSTTFTNFSSSNAIISQTYSASNSTTFTNLSSSNSTTFTNYSSSVSQSISSYSSSNSTTFTNLSSSNSTTFTNYSSSTATSINGLSLGIGTELARVYQTTASLNVQTGSQNSLNTSLGLITSSIYSEITSFNSVFQRIGSTTSSMNTQSGSQDLVNLGISSVTGSLIGITNTLMAFTAALDNTYATDAQLYQLYQATSSIQFATRSLNIQTGSQDIVNFNISTYTGSQNVINSSVDSHILKQATQTGSQDLVNLGISSVTGSLIGITNGLMAFTAALDNTYATDAQLYQLYAETASMKAEIAGIEAYTASLKGQAIVSSSQQITNYYKFAETASANTNFYGGLTVTDYSKFGKSGVAKALDVFGNIAVTGSVLTQQNTIGGFVGSYYLQWDSFGSQGGDAQASVGYYVGAANDDRKLRITSDRDIQLNHGNGIGRKIQIPRTGIGLGSVVELTGSLNITGSSAIVGDLLVTLGGITGSILATNGVLSGSAQIGELTQIAGIEAYTASLKGAAIVSSSQQITNYYKFAETASANTFYGNQKVKGNLDIDNKVSVTGSLIVSSSANQLWATPEFQLYNGLGTVNFALTPNTGNQFTIQAYGTKAEILQANEPLRLLSPTLQFVKYDNTPTKVEITGSLAVSGSTNLTGSVTINQSRIDNGWTAYTPEWTAASSNPVINNGTIEGYYKVIGKTCFVRGNIAMGSTTTFGTGEWYVSMPFTASHADAILMTVTLLDNGSGWYNATMAGARAGFNHKAAIQYQSAGGTANDINPTQPFTWATSDRFIWNGSYEIA